ncbi:MAG: hypothetical protein EZS28_052345 [Streblomastix strix]|uniref:Uncharacterized protein n=1 Tax=Streblomastix strix TaxID=222440 RepID=A0A5J4SC27_9EUKA|nr:MAG: hypothetical protein EZS28_052345 [Streblomastix strix]
MQDDKPSKLVCAKPIPNQSQHCLLDIQWARSSKKVQIDRYELESWPPDTQGNLLNQTNTSESTQSDTVGARKQEQKEKPQLSPAETLLKSFTGQNGNQDVEIFKNHCTELRNEVFSHYYGKLMGKLDATGERASEEVRKELRGQSKDVQSIVGETKEVPVLAGSEDLALEREDQLQAIHIQ